MTTKYDYEEFAENCLYGKLPPCSVSCPLNLDIRALMEQIMADKFTAAYKLLRNHVVFPAIVCNICSQPCKSSCFRESHDAGISIRMLEQSCVKFTNTDTPNKFNLPKKEQRIAIIGGGLTGLTCMLKLASRGYQVTLYERNDRIGGQLWDIMDPDVFLPEIENQIQFLNYDLVLNKEITNLDEIAFDAAYVATGSDGEHFSLLEGYDRKSFGTTRPGVFVGGALLGATPVEGVAQASVAAHSIEKYIKVDRMDGIPESFMVTESLLNKDLSGTPKEPSVQPQNGVEYERDEAVTEAKRCLLCDCTACKEVCELFTYFNKPPKLMVAETITTLSSKSGLTSQQATRTMSSCNLCGLCGEVCPQGINMGSFFYDFRYFKFEDKVYPPAFHDFFIRDMMFSNNEAALFRHSPEHTNPKYLFFPGCQLGASDPRYVMHSYAYLIEKFPDTAILLGCCGAPADWAADRELNTGVIEDIKEKWKSLNCPIVVFACPTCQLQFQKYIPEAKGISLYEVMLENGLPGKNNKLNGQRINVFDPCASRDNSSLQSSVRSIVSMLGMKSEELTNYGEKAQCCGWGGHIGEANPLLEERIVQNRINAGENPYITYCTNCCNTFAGNGKDCIHILDAVFKLNEFGFTPQSLGERRKNRILTKNSIISHFFGEIPDTIGEGESLMDVVISPEMVKKLNRQLILEEEAVQAVVHSETTGSKLFDQENECFIGHLRIGIITYWVVYKKESDKYHLLNAYSHRMEIIEEDR